MIVGPLTSGGISITARVSPHVFLKGYIRRFRRVGVGSVFLDGGGRVRRVGSPYNGGLKMVESSVFAAVLS